MNNLGEIYFLDAYKALTNVFKSFSLLIEKVNTHLKPRGSISRLFLE